MGISDSDLDSLCSLDERSERYAFRKASKQKYRLTPLRFLPQFDLLFLTVFAKLALILSEIGGLRSEVGSLRSEMNDMKSEIKSMRSEFTEKFQKVDDEFRKVQTRFDHNERMIGQLIDMVGVQNKANKEIRAEQNIPSNIASTFLIAASFVWKPISKR